jgi:hypothetical protein
MANLEDIKRFIEQNNIDNLPVSFLYLVSEHETKSLKMVYVDRYVSNTFVLPFHKPISKSFYTPVIIENEST